MRGASGRAWNRGPGTATSCGNIYGKEVQHMAKRSTRRTAAPRNGSREQIIEKVRKQERTAVEKAMEIAIKVYGPAFKELEKY